MLQEFINRRPVVSIIIISILFGLAKGAYTYFDHSSRLTQLREAQVQAIEATRELSKFQTPLTEAKVKAAIEFIKLMPVDKIKARASSNSGGVLDHVFATARAAQQQPSQFNDAWQKAGFGSSKESIDAMMSVFMANTRIVLENGLEKMRKSLPGSSNEQFMTEQQRRALESSNKRAAAPLLLFQEILDNLNVPEENYTLVKPYHDEIQAAMERFAR